MPNQIQFASRHSDLCPLQLSGIVQTAESRAKAGSTVNPALFLYFKNSCKLDATLIIIDFNRNSLIWARVLAIEYS